MSPIAILGHSNLEEVSSNRFALPVGVTLVKLGRPGTCLFNQKNYTNIAYGKNYKNLHPNSYRVTVGNGVKKVTNPLYEMGNINPNSNSGEPNTLLSGVFKIPLPFPRRTKNNQITFNTFVEIRKAKNNHSLVTLNNQKNSYTLKELVNTFHKKNQKTTFIIYACQSFNEGEHTVNSKGTVRSVSSYTVRYRRKNEPHRLVTKQFQYGENALRRQDLRKYTNILNQKLGYKKSNNASKMPGPGQYTVEIKSGRNIARTTETRSVAPPNKLRLIRKILIDAEAAAVKQPQQPRRSARLQSAAAARRAATPRNTSSKGRSGTKSRK